MLRAGVELQQLAGRYKAGTNSIEAKAMVDAAFELMRADPNRSLGIVTLNQKQRDLISEMFEYELASNQQALKYIELWKERNDGLEEFFIKNLENVQGDERRDLHWDGLWSGRARRARDAAFWPDQRDCRQTAAQCAFHTGKGKDCHLFLNGPIRHNSRRAQQCWRLYAQALA
jgi:hypothetical protein